MEGVTYAYHNPAAISTGQAISFTPSGLSYTMNPDEVYDGVVLTTNLTLPEPGIPLLLSPAQDAVIGPEHTFEWAVSSFAESYTLLISPFSDLGGASTYNTGTNLYHNVTGLTLDATYYWGVFATNSTGTTWCEIKKLSTSSIPPLAAVPQEIWIEQTQDKTIKLNYTGGDATPKTAVITTLPAQGQLYQYSAGARGAAITTVPTIVSDGGRNVVYAAPAGSGNGIGNFKFKINDGSGDTPEALIKVNVSPPGMPNVLYLSRKEYIELQFDRPMNDPAGKQGQFEIKVNAIPATITAATLKPGDANTIILTVDPILTGSETISISYTQGNITSASGGYLLSFSDQPVTLRAQVISFTQSLNKTYGQAPVTLSATSGSGLGLTYSSSDLSVATVLGSTLTIKKAGSSNITATQAGNATYAPARYTRALTVSKGNQTITFNTLPDKTTADPDFNPGAIASSGLPVSYSSDNPSVAIISANMIHITGAGTSGITASQPGNANYNPATDIPQTLTVSLATSIEDPTISSCQFKIYYTRGVINIQSVKDEWGSASVRITDITGKPVLVSQNMHFSKNEIIQLPCRLTRGMYLLQIRSGVKRYAGKVMVQ